ncbi:MAG: UDP-glucose/GDP-mannose dehydrogenase family protein [Nitrospira sp.]|nr:UDP-glucose/GDP-mannose dehydrogenase family protein [Nitrospira sp.]MDH4244882.1 UDP-glucose/GDP-mannose dehydrogenase family protein [Nitrospira sp.]MDH4355811.1 UDP-glucose/GDP-mannose dehydrogenase family protein [Nitrospira sp.]MDH5318044.1 UDP-glucose/GDP-mannose dehydrogenase family protein [Nitrospira sp.]
MHISVIGTGYVGLVTGACFAEFGVQVTCMDSDSRRIEKLEKGEIPFYEPGIAELVAKGVKEGRLSFTTNIAQAVDKALVIFIAVGTPPSADGSADLSFVKKVGEGIAHHMNSYKVIVTKSTVPVGTGETIREVVKKTQKTPIRFDIVSNPEFLREGSAIEDFMRPNRVVIGADSDQAIAIMKDLYRPLYLIETPIVVTDVPTAELIKYASNAFLATKISFINEIANLCERVGANVQMVAKGMGLDHRIGSKFLHAGPGFGGSCFPKDLAALIQTGERNGYPMQIASAASRVNDIQRGRMIDKIREAVGGLKGKTLAMLGLSFKPNTNDLREAPALAISRALLAEGASIRAYDPEAMTEACQLIPELQPCRDTYHAAEGADALVLMTEWNVFRNLEFEKLKSLMRTPILLDLRNVYEPERIALAGFKHLSVGRVAQNPRTTT